MSSRHLTLRLDDDIYSRLEAQRRRTGQSRSEVGRALLDEGLRMAAHPGIVFRSGPAGRRPGLVGGPDVWEVVRAYRQEERGSGDVVEQIAAACALSEDQVRTALRYYAEFTEEVDDWIARVDEEAERAEAVWVREQEIIGR